MLGDPEIPEEAEADDDHDEDYIDIEDGPDTINPSMLPQPPLYDDDGHPFIAVVDVSGVHHLPVITCTCDDADPRIDVLYLGMDLFPASFERIQTAFTIDVLKDYRLSNLQCKTSAYQYYQKLRRLTCPAFPKAVLNRYRELRRLSREYRNLKLWKIFGRAYESPRAPDDTATAAPEFDHANTQQAPGANKGEGASNTALPQKGRLASFCPACPQPGLNLPENWKDDPQKYIFQGI